MPPAASQHWARAVLLGVLPARSQTTPGCRPSPTHSGAGSSPGLRHSVGTDPAAAGPPGRCRHRKQRELHEGAAGPRLAWPPRGYWAQRAERAVLRGRSFSPSAAKSLPRSLARAGRDPRTLVQTTCSSKGVHARQEPPPQPRAPLLAQTSSSLGQRPPLGLPFQGPHKHSQPQSRPCSLPSPSTLHGLSLGCPTRVPRGA